MQEGVIHKQAVSLWPTLRLPAHHQLTLSRRLKTWHRDRAIAMERNFIDIMLVYYYFFKHTQAHARTFIYIIQYIYIISPFLKVVSAIVGDFTSVCVW